MTGLRCSPPDVTGNAIFFPASASNADISFTTRAPERLGVSPGVMRIPATPGGTAEAPAATEPPMPSR